MEIEAKLGGGQTIHSGPSFVRLRYNNSTHTVPLIHISSSLQHLLYFSSVTHKTSLVQRCGTNLHYRERGDYVSVAQ